MSDPSGGPKNFFFFSLALFFTSFTVISWQIALMRALSVTHYYHFSYLIISTALLGFGVSGTLIHLFYERIRKHFWTFIGIAFLLFLILIPGSYLLAQNLPLDSRYIFYSGPGFMLFVLFVILIFQEATRRWQF